MKAVIIDNYGGRDVLRLTQIKRPAAGAGQILIRIHAIGVNPADYKWRMGMFAQIVPLTFPHILGYDAAGVVEGGDLPAGTRVVAHLDHITKGGYAEFVAAPAERVSIVPDELAFHRAAAVPTPGLTGVQLIEEHLDSQSGQRVLITGATGAVGRFALHAAKLRRATVVAAVRSAHREEALALGADEVVVPEDTVAPPVDAVADTVGGQWVARLCGALRHGGLIRTVATTPIPSEGLVSTPEFIAVHPDRVRLHQLMHAVAAGAVALPKLRKMALDDVVRVHHLLEEGCADGKIVLAP